MHIRRSLPSSGWYAVLALAFVAALGAATVVGAGLSLWRGSAAQRAVGLPSSPLLGPGSGVVTVPARPTPSPSPAQVGGPTLTRVVGVGPAQPVSTAPSRPTTPVPHVHNSHASSPSTPHPAPPPSAPAAPASPGPPAWAHLGANARAHVASVLARVHPPGLARQLLVSSASSWSGFDESPATPDQPVKALKPRKPPKPAHVSANGHDKPGHRKNGHDKPGHDKPGHEKQHDDD